MFKLALSLFPALSEWSELLFTLPGDEVEIDFDISSIERYGFVLYPVLAIGTLALIAVAIVSALRSDEITGIAKVEYKRAIIALLRREVGGLPVEKIAKALKQNVSRTSRLLESLQEDGIVAEQTFKKRKIWRMRGLSND
ncbi:MAG TPA: hypothetical protein DFS52_20545 [Myxococcales bacterium]|jgi:hypothetical protein|nr:hypothetical protein [Myxococcales bacterium]